MNYKELKQLTYTKKIVYVTLAFLAFVSLLLYFIIIPAAKSMQQTRGMILEVKENLVMASHSKKDVAKTIESYKQCSKDESKITRAFIASDQGLDFIEDIELITKELNLEQKIDLLTSVEFAN